MATTLSTDNAPLEPALPGDQLTTDDLARAFRFLMDQANALNAEVSKASTVEEQQAIGRVQNELFERAAALNAKSIDLLTGQARITANHINSAVAAAKAVIDKIASIQRKLAKLGAVLDFFGAVLTGNGKAILEGAHALNGALNKP
jgi:hypothetical protein